MCVCFWNGLFILVTLLSRHFFYFQESRGTAGINCDRFHTRKGIMCRPSLTLSVARRQHDAHAVLRELPLPQRSDSVSRWRYAARECAPHLRRGVWRAADCRCRTYPLSSSVFVPVVVFALQAVFSLSQLILKSTGF